MPYGTRCRWGVRSPANTRSAPWPEPWSPGWFWHRCCEAGASRRSERDLVVEIVAPRRRAAAGTAATPETAGRPAARAVIVSAREAAAPAAFTAAIQHGQLAAITLQNHFRGEFFDTVLVGPLAGLEGTLQIYLRALFQVLLGDLHEVLVEDHHAMPLGTFLALAGSLVPPGLRGRDGELADLFAGLHGTNFGVAAQIADQDDFVDAARHGLTPIRSRSDLIIYESRIVNNCPVKRNNRHPSELA